MNLGLRVAKRQETTHYLSICEKYAGKTREYLPEIYGVDLYSQIVVSYL